MKYKYLHTKDSLTVVVGGRTYAISRMREDYSEVVDAIIVGSPEHAVLNLIEREGEAVKRMIGASVLKGVLPDNIRYDEGLIYCEDRIIDSSAARRLIGLIQAGHDYTALANFVSLLAKNPLRHVESELYEFLDHGKIPLTPDGHFLAYKAVRQDFKDIHSGKFDNSVGAKPRMLFYDVDGDRDRTCSRGLHVCSYAYLPHFSHADGHVMMCKVDPADVVAIPSDYNNTKMRVAGYEVVEEVTSYYSRGENVLSEDRLMDERFELHYEDAIADDELYDTYYTLEEAKKGAKMLFDEDPEDTIQCWVIDTRTGARVFTYDEVVEL